MVCDDCIFWKEWKQGGRGDCHKHSPVIVADRDGEYSSCWPDTSCEDDCGDIESIS
jgi:hypothetical protein